MKHNQDGSGGKGDAIPVSYSRDDINGMSEQHTIAYTERFNAEPTIVSPAMHPYPAMPGFSDDTPVDAHPFGPEAAERAQMMAYQRNKLIQEESPVVRQEVVEHVVHDQRLYIGMWIVAGVAGVSAYLASSFPCFIVTLVAVGFALSSSPGRQYRS